jgi:ketosteroid isomerase-like protein
MSQENVELVRRAFEAFNRGDLDAASEIADPDIVLRPPETWRTLEGGVAYGLDAVYRFFANYRDAFGPHVEIEEQLDAGDRVVTRYRSHVRGDYSGVEGDLRFTMVHTFREGLVVMIEVFTDHADALRAAGLAE